MIFEVEISDQAEADLRGIFEYIAFTLLAPENATGQSLGETYKKSLGVMSGSIGGEVSIPKAITGNVPAKKQFV